MDACVTHLPSVHVFWEVTTVFEHHTDGNTFCPWFLYAVNDKYYLMKLYNHITFPNFFLTWLILAFKFLFSLFYRCVVCKQKNWAVVSRPCLVPGKKARLTAIPLKDQCSFCISLGPGLCVSLLEVSISGGSTDCISSKLTNVFFPQMSSSFKLCAFPPKTSLPWKWFAENVLSRAFILADFLVKVFWGLSGNGSGLVSSLLLSF